jgi:leucyl/phenylalanyl-tRNA--protein transferase
MDGKKEYSAEDLLHPQNMLRLYASGAFPMANNETGEINWFMPEVRAIIPLNNFNIPRTLKKIIKNSNFEFKFDNDFLSVVKNCADRNPTWISDELIEAYLRLKKKGHVHTVETWQNGKLVGGLYGISFRGAFFGESMFSKISQASKAALAQLIEHLVSKDFILLDVQYLTEHLKMFGAVEISFNQYNKILYEAYNRGCEF